MGCKAHLLFFTYGCLFYSMVHAGDAGSINNQNNKAWHWALGVGGGFSRVLNLGQAQNIPIIDPVTDEFFNYSPNKRKQTKGMFETFIGAERPLFDTWLLQGGLAYTQAGSYYGQGTLVQGADLLSADQYTYQFKTISRQLLVQTKWMHPNQHGYYPYALVGLGTSFNKTSQFTTSVPANLTFTRTYAPNTSSSFAYRLGAGIDVSLSSNVRLGIAYRYSNYGKVQLGSASIDNISVSGTLSQNHLHANEGLIQLSYIL